jgi:KEOPS complex subunit Pcc1
MRHAKFVFVFDSDAEARIILESLKPEVQQKIPKTNVKMSVSKNKFFIEIDAKDTSSLRASCNSYLRWINTALNVKKTV